MKRFTNSMFFLVFFMLIAGSALAAPRDVAAVLNRCGPPIKGDETILEDTPAGGRRILSYESGTLYFNKLGGDGWTFSYGSHGGADHLTAPQMELYLECLKPALADSAAAAPLVALTPVERAEDNLKGKGQVESVVAYSIGSLAVLGLILLWFARRGRAVEQVQG